MRQYLLVSCLGLLCAAMLPAAVAEQRPEPCSTPEYRQFDFWLGHWDVFNPNGELIGENRITLEQGKCVLHEHWSSATGNTGESFNIFDARRGVWHQTWVAATGNLLLLEGGLQGDAMVLSGEQPTRDGSGMITNRITWTPLDDGAVEQRWDQSMDGGETWQAGFVGIYRRSKE